ncbi:dTDP-4-dehydrorhamnose 3,5-epimerase [Candidatus Pseudothioglobus sp. Uisw_050_01]|uniref:dTDP-4-dehydrorhamnose 3,5-epimerase n=1 Tax=Candidatus Pseudothioglobus sp. Uisw_050_01 TaxID=3230997 RepID=UPI003A87C0E3
MSIEFSIEESNEMSGVWIIKPSISEDLRGDIWTSFLKYDLEKLLPNGLFFKHDKFSTSKFNVLRGIHGDTKSWKLVTSVFGEIQQVVVDLRESSETYLKWQEFNIGKKNQKLILIPPGVGNAYYVKSELAVYHYKLAYEGNYMDADEQFSVKWNDPRININWLSNSPLLSNRDR